jgi:hypothetical protein
MAVEKQSAFPSKAKQGKTSSNLKHKDVLAIQEKS